MLKNLLVCEQFGHNDETITIIPSGFKDVFIEVYEDAYYNLSVRYISKEEFNNYYAY
jgi:hypothetical protein